MTMMRASIFFITIISIVFLPCSSGGGESGLTLLGRWDGGPCLGLGVADDFAYYGKKSLFAVVDVSNPYQPVGLGEVQLPALVMDAYIRDNLAYVTTSYQGLQVVDVSDPGSPTVVGVCSAMELARRVTVQGDLAYVADTHNGVRIIDVSEPTDPWQVSYSNPGGFAQDVVIRDGLAYLATMGDGFWVIDVSEPTAPMPWLNFEHDTYYHFYGAEIFADHLFFAAGQGGLRSYELTDPLFPALLDWYNIGDDARDLDIEVHPDGTVVATVATAHSGLRIFDITDPADLILISEYEGGGIPSARTHDGFAYLADWADGMQIVDLTHPNHPRRASSCPAGGYSRGLVVRDGLAYTTESWSGLRILDVSKPADPQPVGYDRLYEYSWDIDICDDHTYTATSTGIWIHDVSDPTAPFLAGSHGEEWGAMDIAVREDRALFTVFEKGLQILDVADPTSPQLVGQLLEDSPHEVVISEDHADLAFVSARGDSFADGGLMVVDYADAGNPVIVSRVMMMKAEDLAVSDGVAFLGGVSLDIEAGVLMVDITTPTAPEPLGFLPENTPFTAMAVDDGYLYMQRLFSQQLKIYDVSDPTQPTLAGTYVRPGYSTRCIQATNGMVYTNGVWIFRNDLLTTVPPGSPQPVLYLEQNYPNPFNPTTTIGYQLTAPSTLSLGIYDLTGRLVCMLKDGVQESAGDHTVTWRGCDGQGQTLASGVYLYRLQTDEFQATRRMVLIR